ncbi:unnamed protein product [Plutella xylostella]|uniref:(diamondback moth) hypothetical protein n=1 Tax=Plutella xylostella TaxID=51655 RepID=A0A8S4DG86_PLUXY|nr:unnamed protein product [Plutella xylostella]
MSKKPKKPTKKEKGQKSESKKIPVPSHPKISDASLLRVPEDALPGYNERILTGIEWNTAHEVTRYIREKCNRKLDPVTFKVAIRDKIQKSILSPFFNKSNLTVDELWEVYLPMILWDKERLITTEEKACYEFDNCITDNIIEMIRKAVNLESKVALRKMFKEVEVLRLIDAKMTKLDEDLLSYKNLITLNLSGNCFSEIDATCLPETLRVLELQNNLLCNIKHFAEFLPSGLMYLGLSKNFIADECFCLEDNMRCSEGVSAFSHLTRNIMVLDLSDNDIYRLAPVLDALSSLPNLSALVLSGNPCAYCVEYPRATLHRLPALQHLDCREVLASDRPGDQYQLDPEELRYGYFVFDVIRIMSVPPPPKVEKGATVTFYVELEVPLLDSVRRQFLMSRNPGSLTELLPAPDGEEAPPGAASAGSKTADGVTDTDITPQATDVYQHLEHKNSREVLHYTKFESSRVPWSQVMTFSEPAVRIFCPDLRALRDTFRTVITVRVMCSIVYKKPKSSDKKDKKSARTSQPQATEQTVTLAAIRCVLRKSDWSQPRQHFHWDATLGTDEAMHWGDGDLTMLNYDVGGKSKTEASSKPSIVKPEKSNKSVKKKTGKNVKEDTGNSQTRKTQKSATLKPEDRPSPPPKQTVPEEFTCHFSFGVETHI